MLVYWTVCVGLDANTNSLTPPLPASPNFFAGGTQDRLVTIQSKTEKVPFDAVTEYTKEGHASMEPLKVLENADPHVAGPDDVAERVSEGQPAAIQVIKGSSIHDIGDIEEQQSSAEDAFELQPVVADGGRLTESSKSLAVDRLDSSDSSTVHQGSRSEDLTHALPAIYPTEIEPVTSASTYVFPDTSNFERLNRLADELPDFVHIPLHMAVGDEVLEGWEEDWFARADYDATKHGRVREPKIDFVYTCKFFLARIICSRKADIQRGQRVRRKICTHNATL